MDRIEKYFSIVFKVGLHLLGLAFLKFFFVYSQNGRYLFYVGSTASGDLSGSSESNNSDTSGSLSSKSVIYVVDTRRGTIVSNDDELDETYWFTVNLSETPIKATLRKQEQINLLEPAHK